MGVEEQLLICARMLGFLGLVALFVAPIASGPSFVTAGTCYATMLLLAHLK